MIKCEICEKEFENHLGFSSHRGQIHKISSEDYYLKYIGKEGSCLECGKKTKFLDINRGYQLYCSKRCSSVSGIRRTKANKTILEKYGVTNIMLSEKTKEKIKKTNLEKYGVEHAFQNEEIKEKQKQTCLEKYGTKNVFQNEEIKKKIKKTNFRKYGCENPSENNIIKKKKKRTCLNNFGVEHPFQSEKIRNKSKKTCLNKYGVEHPNKSNKIIFLKQKKFHKKLLTSNRLREKCIPLFDVDQYKGIGIENKYPFRCKKCNTIFKDHLDNGHVPRCPTCYPNIWGTSLFEQEVSSLCKQYFSGLIENDRTILEGHELDIYIPSIKLAIECNGLYWHSEYKGKNNSYHLNKTLECQKKGIKLIHIFEDEWLNNKNRIKKILLKEMGIIDRKTILKNRMIIDRRFSNGDYLLEKGYKLVETIEPQKYYTFKKDNFYITDLNIVWDCGKLILEKNQGQI